MSEIEIQIVIALILLGKKEEHNADEILACIGKAFTVEHPRTTLLSAVSRMQHNGRDYIRRRPYKDENNRPRVGYKVTESGVRFLEGVIKVSKKALVKERASEG